VTPLFAASIYWDLPVLLVVFSLVYSATRHDRWDRILHEALGWGGRVGGFLLVVGVVLYVASSNPDRWKQLAAAGGALAVAYFAVQWVRHRQEARKAAAKK
jgi:drug/metabolite transporter (DMT)-like permease